MTKEINESYFEKEVLQSTTPTVVMFFTNWCGPSRSIMPEFELLSSDYGHQVKFVKIDADFAEDLVSNYDIRATPTFMKFENGVKKLQFTGANGGQELRNKLDLGRNYNN